MSIKFFEFFRGRSSTQKNCSAEKDFLNKMYPEYINNSLKEAIVNFGRKIDGFNNSDSIIAGIESRTSSPVKIIRDENYVSNIDGIYPCGEGAGYAGGIMSAAVDGVRVAQQICTEYKSKI